MQGDCVYIHIIMNFMLTTIKSQYTSSSCCSLIRENKREGDNTNTDIPSEMVQHSISDSLTRGCCSSRVYPDHYNITINRDLLKWGRG